MLAVIAIGLFALPTTFSYTGAMHTFQQIDPTSEDTINDFCLKCHSGAIATQLAASNNGLYNGGTPIHRSIGCQGCHQITSTVNGPGYNQGAASTEHAARLPTCLDCHNGGVAPSGSTSLMTIGDAGHEIRAGTEAHRNFMSASDNDIECIGCHTATTRTGTVSTSVSSPAVTVSGLTIG